MGGFASVLGSAATGFEQARQQDLQRQFADEQNRRSMASELLGHIALDPNQPDEVRTPFLNAYMNLAQLPPDKKFDFKKHMAPAFDAMAQYRMKKQQAAAAPPPTTPGVQLSTPPAPPQADVNVTQGGTHAQQLAPGTFGPPAQVPNAAQISAPPAPLAFPAPAVQGPPPPPPEFLAGAGTIGRQHAQAAGQQAGAELSSQIGARKQAIEGMNLPPEQAAAFTLGMPTMVGSYGRGDVLSAADASRMGIPMPAGIGADDWVRVQRGKMGNIVGVFPASMPPAYAPTEREGFVQVQQLDGTIKEVPITTVTQKQAPGQSKQSKPTAKVGEGQTVGGKAPTPVTMIAPPSAPGEQPRAVVVRPGGAVPSGSVTPAGYSSVSVPTSSSRTRSEFATGLIPAVDRAMVDVTHAAPKLGALKGRWNEFIAGQLGGGLDDDPEISGLRAEMGLIQTGMMVPHVGARGGVQLISKFKSMIDSGKQDAPQLIAALKEMRKFLVTYAKEGDLKGWGKELMTNEPPPPPKGQFDWSAHPVVTQ